MHPSCPAIKQPGCSPPCGGGSHPCKSLVVATPGAVAHSWPAPQGLGRGGSAADRSACATSLLPGAGELHAAGAGAVRQVGALPAQQLCTGMRGSTGMGLGKVTRGGRVACRCSWTDDGNWKRMQPPRQAGCPPVSVLPVSATRSLDCASVSWPCASNCRPELGRGAGAGRRGRWAAQGEGGERTASSPWRHARQTQGSSCGPPRTPLLVESRKHALQSSEA